MFKSPRLRWAVLLSALAATVAAILAPEDEPVVFVVQEQSRKPVPSPVVAVAVALAQEPSRDWLAAEDNPFSPRGWIAPPPPPPPPAQAPTVAPVVLAEAIPLPPSPIPFRFLGSMSDGDDRTIYLGHGDQLLIARQGDVLEGRYKVARISAIQIEFEDTTSGLRQSLPLPAQDK